MDLLILVSETDGQFDIIPLLDTLTNEMVGKDYVPTKMAALHWIKMILKNRKGDMGKFILNLLPVFLQKIF